MGWFSSLVEGASNALKWMCGNNDISKEKLKWRQSKENIDYHRQQENREFNKSLENKNSKICDAIRKKKQKEIEKIKRGENL